MSTDTGASRERPQALSTTTDTTDTNGFLTPGLRALRGSIALLVFFASVGVAAAQEPPELTAPVNDFAHVIDPASARAIETLILALQQASNDVVVVATVDTVAPYADTREYAVKMFENHGRGIGQKGTDNGVLILLAVKERQVRVEVGYDLEAFITDGFAGQTSREDMVPEFRRGNYGAGLLAGTSRIVGRIAAGRQVSLQGSPPPRARDMPATGKGQLLLVAVVILFVVFNAIATRTRGHRFGRREWSGWNSGVGPFGGPFGGGFGGFGGGSGGGGFGGFGGGRSGGGGGGAGW